MTPRGQQSRFSKNGVLLSLTAGIVLSHVGFAWSADGFEFFQEEALVVTASRRPQAIHEIPMAVDVITAEEIKASGAVNIWDLFRYRPGMDVLDGHSVDGNRGIVSVRGFPQEFSANLLVQLDGRSVYNPYNDGTFWEQLPVQMQDIDRIEIIRGPNAALHGTGAGFGVINIITRKPDGKTGFQSDTRGGNQGLFETAQTIGSAIGKIAYRAGYTYKTQDGFPLAASKERANDFLNKQQAHLRADLPLSERSDLELFLGGSTSNMGVASNASAHEDFDTHFQMAKFAYQFSPGSALEISGSRNDAFIDIVSPFPRTLRVLQYDAEALHRVDSWDHHLNTTYGISYRHAATESQQGFNYGDHRPYAEFYRGYVQQMVKPIDLFTLQGAVAWEHSNISGVLPSYQAAGILNPWPEHAFRASYSVAHTLHDLFPLFGNFKNSAVTQFSPNPDLTPYKVANYEIGYRGLFNDRHLEAATSLFYTNVDHFHLAVIQSQTLNPLLITLQFEDHDNAIARGAEMDLTYHFSATRSVYGNYTYEHITDQAGDVGLRTGNTPAHKVNLGGMMGLGYGISASANLGYKDNYLISSEGRSSAPLGVPAYWRLDARLAYAINASLEVFVAAQNLTAHRHLEFADGLAVPRTYQAGISMKLGGR